MFNECWLLHHIKNIKMNVYSLVNHRNISSTEIQLFSNCCYSSEIKTSKYCTIKEVSRKASK